MPYAYIAIWTIDTVGGARISASQFGILTVIEMLVALLIYIPVAYFADRRGKGPLWQLLTCSLPYSHWRYGYPLVLSC